MEFDYKHAVWRFNNKMQMVHSRGDFSSAAFNKVRSTEYLSIRSQRSHVVLFFSVLLRVLFASLL